MPTGRVSFADEWASRAGLFDDEGAEGTGGDAAAEGGTGTASAASAVGLGNEQDGLAGQQLPPPPSIICPNCGSTQIETDGPSGASVCTECAIVVEENAIVSSVEFVEGAGGASSMVGQFVGPTSSKAYTGGGGGMRGGRYGFSRHSRETTLANGRRRIQDVASRLRLGSHFVDAAHRLFTIAVEKNFVQGRRTTHVVAACLYIACRQEKSQHMLIDFSDALQVNVYTLGTCFLKFRRLLGLKLEIIDPALYVYRFAAHLDLDDKANAVALTALRLVGRMKRDWIVAGRRPAGICAAALLIAARAHGFTRHNQDVTKVLRVCGMTVSNRVKDFEQTPSANLTLDQFNTVDIESEADPPVFTRNRIREARALAIQENNVELLTSGALDDPRAGVRGKKWRESRAQSEKQAKLSEMYDSLEAELEQDHDESKMTKAIECEEEGKEPTNTVDDTQLSLYVKSTAPATFSYPLGNNGTALVLPNQATAEELRAPTQPAEAKLDMDEWKSDMPKSAADEIDDLFRDDDEVRQREAVFNKMNKDYLVQQERKESERLMAEAASKDRENDEAAQAEGRARYLKSTVNRGRKRRREGEGGDDEPTTEDALLAAVSARKISRKINYDAMSALFDDSGGFSTDLLDDGEGPGADYAGYEETEAV